MASRGGNTQLIVRLSFTPVTTDRIRVIPVDDASNWQTPEDNLVSLDGNRSPFARRRGRDTYQRVDTWGRIEQAAGSVPST